MEHLQDSDLKGLNMEEAFYMATKGGGAFLEMWEVSKKDMNWMR